MGKSSINGPFSMAMLNNQRVNPKVVSQQRTFRGNLWRHFQPAQWRCRRVLCRGPWVSHGDERFNKSTPTMDATVVIECLQGIYGISVQDLCVSGWWLSHPSEKY